LASALTQRFVSTLESYFLYVDADPFLAGVASFVDLNHSNTQVYTLLRGHHDFKSGFASGPGLEHPLPAVPPVVVAFDFKDIGCGVPDQSHGLERGVWVGEALDDLHGFVVGQEVEFLGFFEGRSTRVIVDYLGLPAAVSPHVDAALQLVVHI